MIDIQRLVRHGTATGSALGFWFTPAGDVLDQSPSWWKRAKPMAILVAQDDSSYAAGRHRPLEVRLGDTRFPVVYEYEVRVPSSHTHDVVKAFCGSQDPSRELTDFVDRWFQERAGHTPETRERFVHLLLDAPGQLVGELADAVWEHSRLELAGRIHADGASPRPWDLGRIDVSVMLSDTDALTFPISLFLILSPAERARARAASARANRSAEVSTRVQRCVKQHFREHIAAETFLRLGEEVASPLRNSLNEALEPAGWAVDTLRLSSSFDPKLPVFPVAVNAQPVIPTPTGEVLVPDVHLSVELRSLGEFLVHRPPDLEASLVERLESLGRHVEASLTTAELVLGGEDYVRAKIQNGMERQLTPMGLAPLCKVTCPDLESWERRRTFTVDTVDAPIVVRSEVRSNKFPILLRMNVALPEASDIDQGHPIRRGLNSGTDVQASVRDHVERVLQNAYAQLTPWDCYVGFEQHDSGADRKWQKVAREEGQGGTKATSPRGFVEAMLIHSLKRDFGATTTLLSLVNGDNAVYDRLRHVTGDRMGLTDIDLDSTDKAEHKLEVTLRVPGQAFGTRLELRYQLAPCTSAFLQFVRRLPTRTEVSEHIETCLVRAYQARELRVYDGADALTSDCSSAIKTRVQDTYGLDVKGLVVVMLGDDKTVHLEERTRKAELKQLDRLFSLKDLEAEQATLSARALIEEAGVQLQIGSAEDARKRLQNRMEEMQNQVDASGRAPPDQPALPSPESPDE